MYYFGIIKRGIDIIMQKTFHYSTTDEPVNDMALVFCNTLSFVKDIGKGSKITLITPQFIG